MSPWLKKFYTTLEKWAATFSKALIVVSQSDLHKGIQAGIGKVEQYHLIRSAIPLEEFDPAKVNRATIRRSLAIPLDAPVLGTVGRFSTQKNPLDWVRVASKCSRGCLSAASCWLEMDPYDLKSNSLCGRQVSSIERC
jgi:glycosyltransferase involved in cell wall biosynthesis